MSHLRAFGVYVILTQITVPRFSVYINITPDIYSTPDILFYPGYLQKSSGVMSWKCPPGVVVVKFPFPRVRCV